ncbi:hypothetical protein [Glycomyces artemisiae]|uniref:Uncharacterized protein n=1 Tax=Glycomyces artemisiae TaxID=1076443 RepID=A0A2T0UER6_9ACTN|nr:hypothetical protein [Glycomyces artemisiae]PRY56430.1 hypothetical protein B0I28_10979 [Glycomyces artemisiae]
MTLPWTAGKLLTSTDFTSRQPIVVFKNGKQSFSSTVSDQTDADFLIPLPQTGATYVVNVVYGATGATAADIALAWTSTGDPTIVRTMQAVDTSSTNVNDTLAICRELSLGGWGVGTTPSQPGVVSETLTVTTGTDPATLQLVWHQVNSNSVWTTIHDYGWAIAQRIA